MVMVTSGLPCFYCELFAAKDNRYATKVDTHHVTTRLNDSARGGGNTRPEISAFFSDRAGDSRSFHLPLNVNYDTGIICCDK